LILGDQRKLQKARSCCGDCKTRHVTSDKNRKEALRSRWSGWSRFGESSAQDVHHRLDGEFHEEKRLGNQIVSAAHGGVGAAFKIGEPGDEHHGSSFISHKGAQLGAKFKPVHSRHVHIEKDEVICVFGKHVQRGLGILNRGGRQLGFFQGVSDGAARNGFVVHHEDIGLGLLLGGLRLRFHEPVKKHTDEVNSHGQRSKRGRREVFWLVTKLLEKSFHRVGQLRD